MRVARSRFALTSLSLAALVVLAVLLTMCGEEAPATIEPVGEGTLVEEDPVEVEVPEAPQATWSDDTYELTATATGPYVVGVPSTFEVRLTPRGEYHVNRNYPWSVTVTPPAAVLVPTATFDSATAAEMTDTIARFVVPFTPTAAGTHSVTAAVDFGICREEACIFQMHDVLVTVVAADGVAADGLAPGALVPLVLPPGVELLPTPPAGTTPGPAAPPGATSATTPAIPPAAEAGARS
jgi:hypothetical protein